jgi:hypothetical protein
MVGVQSSPGLHLQQPDRVAQATADFWKSTPAGNKKRAVGALRSGFLSDKFASRTAEILAAMDSR